MFFVDYKKVKSSKDFCWVKLKKLNELIKQEKNWQLGFGEDWREEKEKWRELWFSCIHHLNYDPIKVKDSSKEINLKDFVILLKNWKK